jgi:hypothetical protein
MDEVILKHYWSVFYSNFNDIFYIYYFSTNFSPSKSHQGNILEIQNPEEVLIET